MVEQPVSGEAVDPLTLGDLLASGLYVALGLALVWMFFLFRRRIEQQKEAQRLSDVAFEAQMMRMARLEEAMSNPPSAPANVSRLPQATLTDEEPIPELNVSPPAHIDPYVYQPQQVSPPVTAAHQPVEDLYRQPADVVCAAVIAQLRNAGIVSEVDGFMDINANPRGGVVLKLNGGKHALLVPYFESEPFALRNLKRYDLVIYVGRNGKAVVLRSLEELIAEKVAGAMGGFR